VTKPHKLTAIAAAAVVALAVLPYAAASVRSTAATSKVHIAYFGPAGNAGVAAQMKGANAVAPSLNADVTLLDTGFTPAGEIRAIQDALTSHRYQGFEIIPLDSRSLLPIVRTAIAQGIKVGIVNLPLSTANFYSAKLALPGLAATVLLPFGTQGHYVARLIVQACAGKATCQVGYIPGVTTLVNDQILLKVIKADLKSHSNIQFIVGPDGQYLASAAIKSTQDLLQAHPNLNVVASAGDQMSLGAVQAVAGAGKTGKVDVIGLGGSIAGLAAVRSGKMFGTTVFMPQTEAKVATQIVVASVRGTPVKQRGVLVEQQSGLPALLTRNNLSAWKNFKGEW
jgi:ABC-type sugar transport system substrate-binding protein